MSEGVLPGPAGNKGVACGARVCHCLPPRRGPSCAQLDDGAQDDARKYRAAIVYVAGDEADALAESLSQARIASSVGRAGVNPDSLQRQWTCQKHDIRSKSEHCAPIFRRATHTQSRQSVPKYAQAEAHIFGSARALCVDFPDSSKSAPRDDVSRQSSSHSPSSSRGRLDPPPSTATFRRPLAHAPQQFRRGVVVGARSQTFVLARLGSDAS